MKLLIKRLARLERIGGIDDGRVDRISVWLKELIASFPPDKRPPEQIAESKVRVKRFIDFMLEYSKNRKLGIKR